MPQRVFVTGGTGFVGQAVLDELTKRGLEISALVRRGGDLSFRPNVQTVTGNLFDANALDKEMKGCDAVIHLVGIIMEKPAKRVTFHRVHVEGTRAVVDAVVRNGVRRYVHMSALGTRPDAVSRYHQTKYAAEESVRTSGLDWTILRPSLIHGPRGEFMRQEAMWARKRAPSPLFFMPFMPYFGAGLLGMGGAGELQPVYVGDVARAFVDSLESSRTVRQTYDLGGSERLSWPQLREVVAKAVVKKKRLVIPIPVWAGKFYAAVGIAPLLGFNRDQVLMSQEQNTCDMSRFIANFGWEPGRFSDALAQYAGRL